MLLSCTPNHSILSGRRNEWTTTSSEWGDCDWCGPPKTRPPPPIEEKGRVLMTSANSGDILPSTVTVNFTYLRDFQKSRRKGCLLSKVYVNFYGSPSIVFWVIPLDPPQGKRHMYLAPQRRKESESKWRKGAGLIRGRRQWTPFTVTFKVD